MASLAETEPSAPPAPRLPMSSSTLAPSYPATHGHTPFPWAQPESPKGMGSKYFNHMPEDTVHLSNTQTASGSSVTNSRTNSSCRPNGLGNPSPIKSEPIPFMEISVSDARVSHEPHKVAVPGFHRKYITYRVTTKTDLITFSSSPVTVTRRFSDFVSLENLLKVTHRGFFTPPRPQKHVAHTGKLRPQFIERRRVALEQYLNSLCSHRVIARSAELRAFLTEKADLRQSAAWGTLHSPTPNWLHGIQRLVKQVIGKEALIPAPTDAARATKGSHDIMRQCKEAYHDFCSKQSTNLPDKEVEVRRRSDFVRALVSSVGTLDETASAVQRSATERITTTLALGRAFSHLAAFEASAAHPAEAEEAEKFGGGCSGTATSCRDSITSASIITKELHEQARMLEGAITALAAREEALRTATTLDDDLGRLRARAESMQASGHRNALAALQNLTLAEAAQSAAWNEYETVALRNEHDMADCASKAVTDSLHKLHVWAEHHAIAAENEAMAWTRLARSLGGDVNELSSETTVV